MNVQVIAAPDGTPLWFSRAAPGRTHDLTAARAHGIVQACLTDQILADRAYQGAGATIRTPYYNHREQPSQPTVQPGSRPRVNGPSPTQVLADPTPGALDVRSAPLSPHTNAGALEARLNQSTILSRRPGTDSRRGRRTTGPGADRPTPRPDRSTRPCKCTITS